MASSNITASSTKNTVNASDSARAPLDAPQRAAAIDHRRSFIVQAPAGSGKTELLTQRFLNILAKAVNKPEEVLAITFTKKAAAEMRLRIIESLEFAAAEACPSQEPARTNWQLAQAVLRRDAEQGWDLCKNVHRLRIQTIDGFCSGLVQQLPVVSQFGAGPLIEEDCSGYYESAAMQTLLYLGSDQVWAPAIEVLLKHLDNDFNRVVSLLADMLAKRDQWLGVVTGSSLRLSGDAELLREELEQGLRAAIVDHLRIVSDALGSFLQQQQCEGDFFDCVKFAATQIDKANPLAEWMALENLEQLPPVTVDALDLWRALAGLLLTNEGKWRSNFTKVQGFPAPSSSKDKLDKALFQEKKQTMAGLVAVFASSPAELSNALADIKLLPCSQYADEQWEVLAALLKLLPISAALLKVEFQQQGKVDFAEVSQAAVRALSAQSFDQNIEPTDCDAEGRIEDGDDDIPSELALKLDYQLKHLLVDEFQDTSISQYKLIEKIIMGWEPDDGRTLFLVGDPMQSIYRFRQADVSLFMKARAYGVGTVKLHSLVLQTNFRSQPAIVNWNNLVFS